MTEAIKMNKKALEAAEKAYDKNDSFNFCSLSLLEKAIQAYIASVREQMNVEELIFDIMIEWYSRALRHGPNSQFPVGATSNAIIEALREHGVVI